MTDLFASLPAGTPGAPVVPPAGLQILNLKTLGRPLRADEAYIGRGNSRLGLPHSPLANPFVIGEPHPQTGSPMTRDDVCDLYDVRLDEWITARDPVVLAELKRIQDEATAVACWCWSKRCHGLSVARVVTQLKNTQVGAPVTNLNPEREGPTP